MTTTTPRAELEAMCAMLNDAILSAETDGTDTTPQRELLAKYQAKLATMAGDGGMIRVDVSEAIDLLARPKAGAKAANQYGTFQVHYATDRQQAFALSLMDRKDTAKLATGVTAIDVPAARAQLERREFSKKAISTLIDRLLACPDKTQANGQPVPTGRPASDKQYALITRLAAERELDQVERDAIKAAVDGKTLSTKGASAAIDKLFARPKAAVPTARREVEAGMYINDTTGVILRAYLGQNSGQILCKEVVLVVEATDDTPAEYELEYRGRADRFVTADFRRMTLDEAKAWGKTTSTCCVCARRLDVPESVDAGIGPKCAGRL